MDNLTILLIVVLLVLVFIIFSHRENFNVSNNLGYNNNKIEEYQSNGVDYAGVDVESKYFNQLQRDGDSNEHKLWLESEALEKKMQETHECRL
jgi:hypothetical protein